MAFFSLEKEFYDSHKFRHECMRIRNTLQTGDTMRIQRKASELTHGVGDPNEIVTLMMRCIGVYPHHAVFERPISGARESFTYPEIAVFMNH